MNQHLFKIKRLLIVALIAGATIVMVFFASRLGDVSLHVWKTSQLAFRSAVYNSRHELRLRWVLLGAIAISVSTSFVVLWLGNKALDKVDRRLIQLRDYKPLPEDSRSVYQPSLSELVLRLQTLELCSDDHDQKINMLAIQIANLQSALRGLSLAPQAPPSSNPSAFPSSAPQQAEGPSSIFTRPAPPPPEPTPLPSFAEQVAAAFPEPDFFKNHMAKFIPMASDQLDPQLTTEGHHKIILKGSNHAAADYLVFVDGYSEFLLPNPLGNRFTSSLHDLKERGSSFYEFNVVPGRAPAIAKLARVRRSDDSFWIVDERGLIEGDLGRFLSRYG